MALAGFVTHGMWRPSKRGLCRIPGGGGQGGQGLVTDIRTDTLRWGPAEFEVHVERASRLIEIQVSRLGQRKGLGSSTLSTVIVWDQNTISAWFPLAGRVQNQASASGGQQRPSELRISSLKEGEAPATSRLHFLRFDNNHSFIKPNAPRKFLHLRGEKAVWPIAYCNLLLKYELDFRGGPRHGWLDTVAPSPAVPAPRTSLFAPCLLWRVGFLLCALTVCFTPLFCHCPPFPNFFSAPLCPLPLSSSFLGSWPSTSLPSSPPTRARPAGMSQGLWLSLGQNQ